MENEGETSKNTVDQIFTSKSKKEKEKQVEFLTFFEVYVFSQWNFSWFMDPFIGSAVTHTLQTSEELPLG